jgi:lipase ATG15
LKKALVAMSEESKLELKDTAFGVQGKADLVVIEPMSNTGAQKVTSDEEAASLQIEDLACEAELEHAETAGPSNDSKFSQSRVDNNGQTNTQFADHFTLKVPSSAVRFRGTTVLVHELRSSQIHLIEKMRSNRSTRQNPSIGDVESEEEHQEHQHEILVKNVKNDKTSGLNLLRLLYSLVCFFFSGMLLLLCFQVLLFLFMDLVVDIGLTTEPRNLSSFIGTLLAVPMFIYGFSSAMSIAGAFVVDTWNGHTFLRKVGNWNIILTEWASFIALLGIPLFTWTILLFAGKDQFWEITLICWFSCVAIYYVFFAFAVMYYEIQASWLLMKELHHRSGGSDDSNERRSFCTIVCRAIVLRQTYQFSGITDTVRMTNVVNEDQVPDHKRTTMYTRMTISGCCTRGRLFEKVDPAERLNSIEEVLGTRQFLTANTWSLEKIFCSNQRTQSVAIVRGPSALLPAQMRSSLICSIGGIVLAILALVAVLVWLNNTGLVIFFLVLIIVLSCIPRVQSSIRIYRMYKDVLEAQDEQDGMYINTSVETDGIYQTFEKYRVSRPSLGFCWFLFWLEICIFLIWPLITLFAIQNYPIAVLFLTVSIIT